MSKAGVLAELLDGAEPAMQGWASAANAGDLVAEAREDVRAVRVDKTVEGKSMGVELDGVSSVVGTLCDDDGRVRVGDILAFADYDLALDVGGRFAVYNFVCTWRVRMLIFSISLR